MLLVDPADRTSSSLLPILQLLQGKQLVGSQLVDFLHLWLLLRFHGEALGEHVSLALHLHTS